MKTFILIFILSCSLWAQKNVIGKNELITFSDLGLKDLKAKIDTGAKTSSLHCSVIQPMPDGMVSFILLDKDHKKFTPLSKTAKISRIAKVKSSNGKVQKRYFIKTSIFLLGKEYLTEFSLTNRGNMKYPVLIGRSLLKKDFLVDVTKEYTFVPAAAFD